MKKALTHLETLEQLNTGTQVKLPKFPDIKLPDIIKHKPDQYKDDWKICPNCGCYYVEPHICITLWRKLANDPSQSDN